MIRAQLLTPSCDSAYFGDANAGSPTTKPRETKLTGFAENGCWRSDRRNVRATRSRSRSRSLSAAFRIGRAPDHHIGHTAVSRVVGEPTKLR